MNTRSEVLVRINVETGSSKPVKVVVTDLGVQRLSNGDSMNWALLVDLVWSATNLVALERASSCKDPLAPQHFDASVDVQAGNHVDTSVCGSEPITVRNADYRSGSVESWSRRKSRNGHHVPNPQRVLHDAGVRCHTSGSGNHVDRVHKARKATDRALGIGLCVAGIENALNRVSALVSEFVVDHPRTLRLGVHRHR